jgi:hypothetical protein
VRKTFKLCLGDFVSKLVRISQVHILNALEEEMIIAPCYSQLFNLFVGIPFNFEMGGPGFLASQFMGGTIKSAIPGSCRGSSIALYNWRVNTNPSSRQLLSIDCHDPNSLNRSSFALLGPNLPRSIVVRLHRRAVHSQFYCAYPLAGHGSGRNRGTDACTACSASKSVVSYGISSRLVAQVIPSSASHLDEGQIREHTNPRS